MRTENDYSMLLAEVEQEFPDFKLARKQDSKLMRFIGGVMKVTGADAFMTKFTTTMGTTIYTPIGWDDKTIEYKMAIVRHERVHMRQARKEGRFLFSLKYAVLPVPSVFAYFRMKYEQEAYEESLRANLEFYGKSYLLNPNNRARIVEYFTSAQYFWTWPWKKSIENWYDNTVAKLLKTDA
jgi:hypothetical protein